MKASGERKVFATGAHRDEDPTKPALDLISPFAEERLGVWLGQAAQRYGARNWEKGMPVSRCFKSLKRHVNRFQQGKTDEDHLAAVMCNAMMIIHTQEMVKRGVLPKELDDMPRYAPPTVRVGYSIDFSSLQNPGDGTQGKLSQWVPIPAPKKGSKRRAKRP